MNEPLIPEWFLDLTALCLVAQTCLLVFLCGLVRLWAGNLNRKLHRIESNTRHAADAACKEGEAYGPQTTDH